MTSWKPGGLLFACVLACTAAAAEPTTLTLDEALAVAREQSPDLVAARYEREAAVGAIRGAGVLPNASLDAGLGYRSTVAGPEVQVGISQPLSLAEAGPARGGARAKAHASEDRALDVERQVVAEVSEAFLRVRHADARVGIAGDVVTLAEEVVAVARRRADVGELSEMVVGSAELALASARALHASERAEREAALGALTLALGVGPDEPLVPVGPLLSRERYASVLEGTAVARPDVDALFDTLVAAEADLRLARARALPDVGVWGRYAQEEGAEVGAAGVSLEIPLSYRAQGERAVAEARVRQVEAALLQGQRAASVELAAAIEVYRLRLEAFDLLDALALPGAAAQSEAAGRAYELGEMPLAELLVIRGQVTQARQQHADAELEAAIAGVRMLEAAGWTR